jgi:hypothetical protein
MLKTPYIRQGEILASTKDLKLSISVSVVFQLMFARVFG